MRYKLFHFTFWLSVACCLYMAMGCGAVAHTVGLATTDDIKAQAHDQANVDMIQSNAIADVFEGLETPAGMVNRTRAASAKAIDNADRRTAPPQNGLDWNAIILGILGVAGLGGGAIIHRRVASVRRSLKETDDWVEEIEKKSAPPTPA